MIQSVQQAKVRSVNTGRSSPVAKARQELYRHCTVQVNNAIAKGFYLEAIALLESMITDRLESRISAIHGQDETYRKFRTIGFLLHGRGNKHDHAKRIAGLLSEELNEPEDLVIKYQEVRQWSKDRNSCMHQMVKLGGKSFLAWNERVAHAKNTAEVGYKLFRELSKLVDTHKNLLDIHTSSSESLSLARPATLDHSQPP